MKGDIFAAPHHEIFGIFLTEHGHCLGIILYQKSYAYSLSQFTSYLFEFSSVWHPGCCYCSISLLVALFLMWHWQLSPVILYFHASRHVLVPVCCHVRHYVLWVGGVTGSECLTYDPTWPLTHDSTWPGQWTIWTHPFLVVYIKTWISMTGLIIWEYGSKLAWPKYVPAVCGQQCCDEHSCWNSDSVKLWVWHTGTWPDPAEIAPSDPVTWFQLCDE